MVRRTDTVLTKNELIVLSAIALLPYRKNLTIETKGERNRYNYFKKSPYEFNLKMRSHINLKDIVEEKSTITGTVKDIRNFLTVDCGIKNINPTRELKTLLAKKFIIKYKLRPKLVFYSIDGESILLDYLNYLNSKRAKPKNNKDIDKIYTALNKRKIVDPTNEYGGYSFIHNRIGMSLHAFADYIDCKKGSILTNSLEGFYDKMLSYSILNWSKLEEEVELSPIEKSFLKELEEITEEEMDFLLHYN